ASATWDDRANQPWEEIAHSSDAVLKRLVIRLQDGLREPPESFRSPPSPSMNTPGTRKTRFGLVPCSPGWRPVRSAIPCGPRQLKGVLDSGPYYRLIGLPRTALSSNST